MPPLLPGGAPCCFSASPQIESDHITALLKTSMDLRLLVELSLDSKLGQTSYCLHSHPEHLNIIQMIPSQSGSALAKPDTQQLNVLILYNWQILQRQPRVPDPHFMLEKGLRSRATPRPPGNHEGRQCKPCGDWQGWLCGDKTG